MASSKTGLFFMSKKLRFLFYVFIWFLFLGIILSPNVYAAVCNSGEIATDLGCLPSDPVGFVETLYGWGIMIIGSVGLLFIIIGGYYVMTSRGNTEMLAKGKSFIFYSIAGILLAVFGFVFVEIIAGDLIKIPGFN